MAQIQRNMPRTLCQQGKLLYFWSETDKDRAVGLELIRRAAREGDPDAKYILGILSWAETEEPYVRRPCVPYMELLWQAASAGHVQARQALDRFCLLRCPAEQPSEGALKDARGKPIEIHRTGPLMPVKVQLQRIDGENVLTIRVKIAFLYTAELENRALFEAAVLAGIQAWEGSYTAFGGKVRLRVETQRSESLLGSVVVSPMSEQVWGDTRKLAGKLLPGQKREKVMSILDHRRSFAGAGLRWSLRSFKCIVIQDETGAFADDSMIRDVAKHEFGHVLGLGDLYPSRSDGYPGVPFGSHPLLDAYSIRHRWYHLVMCDQRGPISGKDVEMVMLAFREGRMQLYQKGKPKDRISNALTQ